MWRRLPISMPLLCLSAWAADAPATFDQTVRPFVAKTCVMCHNASLASGGLNLAQLNSNPNVIASRDVWEKVVAKMHGGEMPPPAAPRPDPEKVQAVVPFLKSEFLHPDLAQTPDPAHLPPPRLHH